MGDDAKAPVPAAPDYSGITGALAGNSSVYNSLNREMYDWAKTQYNKNRGVTDDVVTNDLDTQHSVGDFSRDTFDRFSDKYRGLEDQQIDDAQNYASDARRDKEVGAAQAKVGQQFDAARAAAQRELEGYGINPAATRFAALDIGTRSQEAAAKAAAGTTASNTVDNTARALRSQAIDTGQKDVNAANTAANTSTNAGTAANNAALNTTTSGVQTMGTPTQYAALSNNALGMWGNTLNQSYGNQMSQYNAQNAQNNQSSGIGSAIGAGVGLAAMFLAKGGAVDDGDGDEADKPFVDHHYYVLPIMDEAGHRMSPDEAIQRYMHTGHHLGVYPSDKAAFAAHGGPMGEEPGVVPDEASPTGGEAVDDVKAQLTAGEFVMPKDVVSWYGEKYFYNQIAKAQAEREAAKQSTGAVPEEGPEQPGPTTFRSGDAALPAE